MDTAAIPLWLKLLALAVFIYLEFVYVLALKKLRNRSASSDEPEFLRRRLFVRIIATFFLIVGVGLYFFMPLTSQLWPAACILVWLAITAASRFARFIPSQRSAVERQGPEVR